MTRAPTAAARTIRRHESGIYVIDVRNPENLNPISFAETPTGHTTTCVNDCKWVWTGGPAPNTDQRALGWAGRPIFVTDMRDPPPEGQPDPIDTGRNDGVTDYAHDVQVDESGVAWVSGRGGVRGYWTKGRHFDAVLGASRVATADDPVPYAGGGIEENVFPVRSASRFIHNAGRPLGDDAPDPRYGDLIYATEEEFAGGAFPNGCANDGPLFISSLEGSYDGEAWRSTPSNKFRLKTVATWHPFGKEGSSTSTDCSAHYFEIKDRILSIRSTPRDRGSSTSPTRRARPDRLLPARYRYVGDLSTRASTTRPIATACTCCGRRWRPDRFSGAEVAEPRALSANADDAVPEADPGGGAPRRARAAGRLPLQPAARRERRGLRLSRGRAGGGRAQPPARRPRRLHCRAALGGVVQLVRTPACHAGGRGFESRRSRRSFLPAKANCRTIPC